MACRMTAQPTAPLSEAEAPVDAETVAHLMAPAVGVFRREMSVAHHHSLADYERRIASLWPGDKLPLLAAGAT